MADQRGPFGYLGRVSWKLFLVVTAAASVVALGLVSCAGPGTVPETGASSPTTGVSSAVSSPATTDVAPTAAPAATVAPGSTEAAPNAAERPTALATAAPTASAEAATEPTSVPSMPTTTLSPAPPTEAPLPTAPAAPTEPAPASSLPPTPDCGASQTLTAAQTEGPYYKAGAPERASLLEQGVVGDRLVVTGYVITQDCKPVPGALLDFWQADGQGRYDNQGYRLRGKLFTDAQGRYTLETVVPGEYPGRTEHIHVKVQAPGGQVLTTQLYFPGEPNNQQDGIFDPSLLMDVQDTAEGKVGTFNFVLESSS